VQTIAGATAPERVAAAKCQELILVERIKPLFLLYGLLVNILIGSPKEGHKESVRCSRNDRSIGYCSLDSEAFSNLASR
jgi:hypothetical protein